MEKVETCYNRFGDFAMKDRLKAILLTTLIMVIIGILLFFNYYYFKLSPQMLYDNEDEAILQLFEKNNNLNNLLLESRYTIEDIYYSAVDDNNLYLFLTNGNLIKRVDKSLLNYQSVNDVAATLLNDTDFKIDLAHYNEKLVYVIVSDDYDIFIDFYDYTEVFRYRKGIEDE